VSPQYAFSSRRGLGLTNGFMVYGKSDNGAIVPQTGYATGPDHIALTTGRNGLTLDLYTMKASPMTDTAYNLVQNRVGHWDQSATTYGVPQVDAYLPQVNNWEHANAGPYQGAALIRPSWKAGYWTNTTYYMCNPNGGTISLY
jgi:hypothetical protein